MKWVEHVATYALDKGKGLIAASAGKVVRLFDQSGQILKELTHPSTVTGLVFDAKGKRDRGLPLQRRLAVVRRGQDRHPAEAGVERQPHRHHHPSRRRGRRHRDAGERSARLEAAGRRSTCA